MKFVGGEWGAWGAIDWTRAGEGKDSALAAFNSKLTQPWTDTDHVAG